jgi:hypothetical protein
MTFWRSCIAVLAFVALLVACDSGSSSEHSSPTRTTVATTTTLAPITTTTRVRKRYCITEPVVIADGTTVPASSTTLVCVSN